MPELIVIYDPKLEIGAVVDADNRVGYGPAAIGPNAATQLEAFLQSIPYDITEVSSYVLRDWFEQFTTATFPQPAAAAGADTASAVEPPPGSGVAEGAVAVSEAVATAASPPAAAPADADVEADQGEADSLDVTPAEAATALDPAATGHEPYEGPCFACNGTGNVPGATEGSTVSCNLCRGTGHLPVVTA